MNCPLFPYADELSLSDRELCKLANEAIDDSQSEFPLIELQFNDDDDNITMILFEL